MPRAVAYARVSRDEQAKNFSLPTQLQACREYAARHGLTITHEITDDETGKTLNRPGFAEVRALIAAKQVDALITLVSDRLHRSMINQALIRNEFQKAGITIHYVQRGELRNTPEARLTDNIDGAIAEYERERTRERSMRGTRGKVESGKVPGGGKPKYGYDYVGERRERALVINEAQAAIIREIHERFHAGDIVADIRRDLTSRNVPTWTDIHGGKPRRRRAFGEWDESAIYGILRDEAYSGVFRAFRHVVVDDKQVGRDRSEWIGVPCPAIIGRELWQANQEHIDRNIILNPRNTKRFYLLRGMVRCGVCGASMTGATVVRSTGKENQYYRCINANTKTVTPCNARHVPSIALDKAVWAAVRSSLYNHDFVVASLEQIRAKLGATQAQYHERVSSLQKQRTQTQASIDRLLGLYGRGIIANDADLERQITPLNAQRVDIERQLQELLQAPRDPAEPITRWLNQDWSLVHDGLAEADEYDDARRTLIEGAKIAVTVTPLEAKGHFRYQIAGPLLAEPIDRTLP